MSVVFTCMNTRIPALAHPLFTLPKIKVKPSCFNINGVGERISSSKVNLVSTVKKKKKKMRESHDITVDTNSSTPLLEESEVKDKKEVSGMKQWRREIVKSIVYAGLEAIFTCFSLISAISATNLSSG